jgi:hypothetical protein
MTQTDSSDTQSPPTTPTSQPTTQAQASTTSAPPTIHFEEAVPTLTEEEQYEALYEKWTAALQAQLDDVSATIHPSQIDQVIPCLDSSSDFTDEIDHRIDYRTASALEILQDMYDHMDDVYHPVTSDFTDEVPEIKIKTTVPSKLAPVHQSDLKASIDEIDNHIDGFDPSMQLSTDNCIEDVYDQVARDFTGDIPVSPSKIELVDALPPPPSPPTENMDFPRFSCYMGTPTNLQPTVSPADFSKFLLPSRTSATGSYVDHKIPLPIFDVGNFMKTGKDMQSSGNNSPLLDRPFDFIIGLRFIPKDFSSLLVCPSADDSNGLPPEQGLFPLANHTISDVGRFMKNLKDLPACGDDPPLLDRFFDFLGGLRFAPKDFLISSFLFSTVHLTYC